VSLELLAELEEAVGAEAIAKLSVEYGGTAVSIPAYAQKNHWLSRTVGFEVATKICDHLRIFDADGRVNGFHKLYIPAPELSIRQGARRAAEKLLNDGLPASIIARKCGISERTVYRIKAGIPKVLGTHSQMGFDFDIEG